MNCWRFSGDLGAILMTYWGDCSGRRGGGMKDGFYIDWRGYGRVDAAI